MTPDAKSNRGPTTHEKVPNESGPQVQYHCEWHTWVWLPTAPSYHTEKRRKRANIYANNRPKMAAPSRVSTFWYKILKSIGRASEEAGLKNHLKINEVFHRSDDFVLEHL